VIDMTSEFISIVMIGGVAATILLMFLPAILEVWKPKDAGPRLIAENFCTPSLTLNKPSLKGTPEPFLVDIENEIGITKIYTKTLGFLFNLESFTVE
jgi:hypothetical protein